MIVCNCGTRMTHTYRFSSSGSEQFFRCKKCGAETNVIFIKRTNTDKGLEERR